MWDYDDYITLTDQSAKLTRLRLHIQEVSARIRNSTSADGKSSDSHTLMEYLKVLKAEESSLSSSLGSGGSVSKVRFRAAR